MDKNRRIILTILLLVLVSCILAVIDISLKMKTAGQKELNLSLPEFGPGVGIIRIYGPISISESDIGVGAGSDGIVKKLSKLGDDGRIKAIVVRINSPGGTVAATQEIFEKLMELRKRNIILVASMGDVAASGGYYIASACNYIFANNGTITGSIGVIAASPNIKGLFEKLGIRMNVIKSGKYKDILSSFRDLNPDEREMIQEMIDSSYNKFLKDVSLGRNIPISDIQPHADGRVVNGETAIKYKLIDAIGTFDDSIDKAKSLAKLPKDAAVYDQSGNSLEQLLMSIEGSLGRGKSIESVIKEKKFSMIEYSIEP